MGGINESTWGSTTSHHFATPHNNNTTSPQLKTTKPTPHGQNAVHHHHRSLPCPRGRCLCPVQWHCSIWHCHGHRFRLWRRHWLQPDHQPHRQRPTTSLAPLSASSLLAVSLLLCKDADQRFFKA